MSLFEPKNIAIIGASADKGSVGHDILKNLLTQGYEGDVFPINPKHDKLQGKKTYKSVKDVETDIDLAIIVVPAKVVPVVLKECGEKNIQNIVIISAGFAETHTDEGIRLEEEIKDIANSFSSQLSALSSFNVIGPNCLGIVRPSIHLNASFAAELPPGGGVALISQSGATAVAVMDASERLGIGYSLVASIGNKTVMDESDLLEIAADDAKTQVIGLYLENMKDGRRFLKTAMRCNKPIVLLKAGISEQGSKAASSHTGALAGNDAGIKALCSQSGIIRAENLEEFLDLLEGLSTQPRLASENIAIVTNAGGPGILATDAATIVGLRLPALSEKTEKKLREYLPETASTKNPIDVIGDAGVDRYEAALEAVGESTDIDGLALLLTPQVMTPVQEIANALIEWRKKYPMMPVVTCLMGEKNVQKQRLTIQKAGIPSYETPERAMNVLGALRPVHDCGELSEEKKEDRAEEATSIIEARNGLLDEETAQTLCNLYDIPIASGRVATTEKEALAIANDLGYPVVAKVSSPDILHKTDIGGIITNIQNDDEIKTAFHNMKNSYEIRGIFIQKMMEPGDEFIVGMTRDPSFGPLIMGGLGGIYTEVMHDTSFRIAPIKEEEAYHMLTQLRSWKVLLGARGKAQRDIDGLANIIVRVSQLAFECPQIQSIDCNPILVKEDTAVAIDVKIVL
ncbi:MAG: acetate--CoA ligase family protein [Candidatus Peregrinibacteria bacterium]|nr:acetate--CoA ligase family protein [Candidatus Peregrinibacteria bacterium]MCB9808096.1 acetate--CoA ligase family protein [Candidatus Peribacteria bacterium]